MGLNRVHHDTMRIAVGSTNPVKIEGVQNVFRQVFQSQSLEVFGVEVESGVPEQPIGAYTSEGAINRANRALDTSDFGVGIEAGLIEQPGLDELLHVQSCAIVDQMGRLTLGHGPGFLLPPEILEAIRNDQTVGQAMGKLTGNFQIGSEGGAIEYLSNNLLTRTALTEQAVLMALIPRIREELYR